MFKDLKKKILPWLIEAVRFSFDFRVFRLELLVSGISSFGVGRNRSESIVINSALGGGCI